VAQRSVAAAWRVGQHSAASSRCLVRDLRTATILYAQKVEQKQYATKEGSPLAFSAAPTACETARARLSIDPTYCNAHTAHQIKQYQILRKRRGFKLRLTVACCIPRAKHPPKHGWLLPVALDW